MGNLSLILVLSLFFYFALCQNAAKEISLVPAQLENIGQFLKILKLMNTEESNSFEKYDELTVSPRKNCLIDEPTKVKTTVKMNSIEKFHQDTHELFLGLFIDYSWIDERLRLSRNMRLPFDKVVSSTFWHPSFDFKDVTIITPKQDKFVFMDHQVNYLNSFIFQLLQKNISMVN